MTRTSKPGIHDDKTDSVNVGNSSTFCFMYSWPFPPFKQYNTFANTLSHRKRNAKTFPPHLNAKEYCYVHTHYSLILSPMANNDLRQLITKNVL